jgi:hypothetical protein
VSIRGGMLVERGCLAGISCGFGLHVGYMLRCEECWVHRVRGMWQREHDEA